MKTDEGEYRPGTNVQKETFWGAIYGALTDRYGVSWSFNHMLTKE